ncbi:MAG: CoA pyrophosphatase [Pseudohongiellaceae bacterium]
MGDDHELLNNVRAFFRSGSRQDTHPLRPDIQASDLLRVREASVLIPFHSPPGVDEPHILLTLRPEYLRSHAGQVSLPGGRREPEDESPQATALRESEEEIGAQAHQIEVIGELGAVYMPSGYRITPFVGILAPDTQIRPCPVEVECTFHAPASLLLNPDNYRRSSMIFRNREREILELQYGEYRIWGATAAILHGFGQAIQKSR